MFDSADDDLRASFSRQGSGESSYDMRRVDSLADIEARGGHRACFDPCCALEPFAMNAGSTSFDSEAGSSRGTHLEPAPSRPPCGVDDRYDVDRDVPLGRGSYGVVCAATRKADGERFACKTIQVRGDAACWDRLHAEIAATRRLDHPNICRLHEVFYEDRRVHLVMDLCSGGELWDYVRTEPPAWEPPVPGKVESKPGRPRPVLKSNTGRDVAASWTVRGPGRLLRAPLDDPRRGRGVDAT